ncbi:DNA glycosylase AlkZ-like family protein [Nocardia asteroides]|uniref:DNA glycosylase AlkZ-like family protein n=1 Tax=Nocardia asteroides TaxID=1824 RepID=UPI001E5C335A|nr:crosslink repair DNA glycosylase YcaQ family protein [Nocardia asteroides]UGT62362.1 winged helix DNA-binding domain-containing protein [Nocardia asteroides]
MIRLTAEQVFAWRSRRQFLVEPADSAVEVVRRLAGVQAQVASAAELAVALRSAEPAADGVAAALGARKVLRTWAMRGTLHVLTAEQAAAALALVASARTWEKPVWTRNFGATPEQITALGAAVEEILADAALSREELVAAVIARPGLAHLDEQLRSGWGAVLKPLAWQGILCHGPARGSRVTFTSPARAVTDWPGLPEPDAAAATLILAYLGAHGPATPETFDAWLSRNSLRKTVVRRWFAELGPALTRVEVDGRGCFARTEDLDGLAAARPLREVLLLGGFDQYVLGPGTTDTALVPAAHRAAVSRPGGWISPVLVQGGRVTGTWERDGDDIVVTPFGKAPTTKELAPAAARLAAATGAKLRARIG